MTEFNPTAVASSGTMTIKVANPLKSIIQHIVKRDGRKATFDPEKIVTAIYGAAKETKEFEKEESIRLAETVVEELERVFGSTKTPNVENIQDTVEKILMKSDRLVTAKAYILYREEHAKIRGTKKEVPEEMRKMAKESKKYFRNQLAEFVYYAMYARWLPEKNRRETWLETIDRYITFMRSKLGDKISETDYAEIREAMLKMDVQSSMRLLWGAGTAVQKNNCVAYNCSYIAPTKWQDLAEIMFLSMSGCGVGFSIERENTEQFPIIKKQTGKREPTHVVEDSKQGWGDALVAGLTTWTDGKDIDFDYSLVRKEGARLVTMGGRASGPAPLQSLLKFSHDRLFARQGRRLSSLDLHDLICKIGEIVVAGGVRRSAMISLSSLEDPEMRAAKNGQFYLTHPERSMSNNSVAYNEKPTVAQFMEEWVNLMASGSGERGIFNRSGLKAQVPARRWPILEPDAGTAGLNPCGEIILKSKQFCNLTQITARPEDTDADLLRKVRLAAILGTFQATLTDFPYLSPEWKKNCEEEALLGVAISGVYDSPMARNPITLRKMRQMAIDTNIEYAKKIGVNPSTAVTAIKPAGNSSQLCDCSSGIHPRYSKYYIRRVRIERHNPLFMLMKEKGIPFQPEVGQPKNNATTLVLEFPIKAPNTSVTRNEVTALEHLETWKMFKENYTEHNPSCTVYVGEEEWLKVGNWVYENWDIVGGLSFLPRSEHIYQLAPYEEINKETYERLAKNMPDIDFSEICAYEYEDKTESGKELACVSGVCEINEVQ